MIPVENDPEIKRTLIVTRGMSKGQIVENKRESTNNEQPDQLLMWNCISLNDVKNMRQVTFQKEKENYIKVNDKFVHVGYSDNSAKLDSILKKLYLRMKKENITKLAININDEIIKKHGKNEINEEAKRMLKNKSPQLNILIFTPPKHITNKDEQLTLIEKVHKIAHTGIRRTMLKLKQNYVWKNMKQMIARHIQKCEKCAKCKQTRNIKEPMMLTDTPSNSFETIEIDTVGPLRISNNYRYILTIQCNLTKYIIAYPIESKHAEAIARTLVEQVILKYGMFKVLKSDRGTEFANELLKKICDTLKIEQKFSSPYHHESIGSLERNHRVMNEFMLTSTSDHEWDKWLPYYTFAYNTTPHVDTGYSPFELIFGKLPYEINNESFAKQDYDLDSYATELKTKLKFSLTKAREMLNSSKSLRTNKPTHINQGDFIIGDLVLMKVANRKKYEDPYKGPYKIKETLGVNSKITIGSKDTIVHNNLLKKYYI